ncbi:MAG: FAD:protein FMN transferase [Firmicutes bacterium]|nr:FAD:protein FMN transferase [Bacillota bacterium]HPU01434.1 FAD:protein FMN transferase [Bacillota bacterium]
MSQQKNARSGRGEEKAFPTGKKGPLWAGLLLLMAAAAVAVALAAARGGSAEKLFSYQRLLMDTDVSVQFYSGSSQEAEAAKEELFQEMRRLEQLLSYTESSSEVGKINRAAGKEPVQVGPEAMEAIAKAIYFAGLSEGAFDPSVAPLLDLWGFRGETYRVPSSGEIEAAAALVDYRLVEIDRTAGTIFLPQPGMALDLGGIAKGYIIDRGLELLARRGMGHALINAGGDIGVLGPKPDGSPWRIGVKHPRREGELIAVIPCSQKGAVVTSGDYERFFEKDGERYHHILDPQSGYPARTLISVTVVAPTAVEADALSTAIFVLGPQRGLELVESLPGIEAILVTPQLDLFISSGLQDRVELPGKS